MKRIIILLIAAVAVIALILVVRDLLVEDEMMTESEVVTLEGQYICLPHRDTAGPVTLECALGLQVGEGINYALDMSGMEPDAAADFATNELIEVTGELTRIEGLPETEPLLRYDIEGIIRVTSLQSLEAGEVESHVAAGGIISFERPEGFGLAVTPEQVLVESSVPPCAERFDYCLYFNEGTYEGTNFESAGLRIEERTDLTTRDACLSTQPPGYTNLTPEITESDAYATSVFAPIRDAATGQVSEGELHRLAYGDACYEFETRIATSQLGNFEPGAVEAFSEADRQALADRLADLLARVRIEDRADDVVFPR